MLGKGLGGTPGRTGNEQTLGKRLWPRRAFKPGVIAVHPLQVRSVEESLIEIERQDGNIHPLQGVGDAVHVAGIELDELGGGERLT